MFYVFKYNYMEENFNSVIWAEFTDLKAKQNWTHSFNKYRNPKPIQYVLKSKNKNGWHENNCHKPFISVTDEGRHGNRICEFLTLYLFKIKFGIRAVVSSNMYLTLKGLFETVPLPHLPNSCFETTTKSIYNDSFENIYEIFKKNVSDDENILNVTNIAHYTFIDHYPCPMEHLMFYRQKFHSLMKFKNEKIKAAKYILENALKTRKLDKSGIILVGTHVRRSDYIGYTQKVHIRYPSDEYYTNAFNLFRLKCKNAIFIVVSDDIQWCEEKLSAPDVIIAGNGNTNNPLIDFTLLTLCDHHIRGLGTFGFTSAFLGTGSAVIFRRRDLDEKPILTLEKLSKSNFTCDSSSQFYFVDE
ncbi:UNVERIFIED_CONTAM: hypothetical protein RMT77_003849 [Armadillidium vulgare]